MKQVEFQADPSMPPCLQGSSNTSLPSTHLTGVLSSAGKGRSPMNRAEPPPKDDGGRSQQWAIEAFYRGRGGEGRGGARGAGEGALATHCHHSGCFAHLFCSKPSPCPSDSHRDARPLTEDAAALGVGTHAVAQQPQRPDPRGLGHRRDQVAPLGPEGGKGEADLGGVRSRVRRALRIA